MTETGVPPPVSDEKCLKCGHVHAWEPETDYHAEGDEWTDEPWGECACGCKCPNYNPDFERMFGRTP